MKISSYPKVYACGHPQVLDIFQDEVIIEEKVDGSQFSFGILDGTLVIRSKGQEIYEGETNKLFKSAVETVLEIKGSLRPEYVYRGEVLYKNKHNIIEYSRTPEKNIILFDIDNNNQSYMSRQEKEEEAKIIGLEIVPILFSGRITDVSKLYDLLDTESCLGGSKIEGIVIKNYNKFTNDKKAMFAKYISEKFKEIQIHSASWRSSNPSMKDYISLLGRELTTNARWEKAIQHLKESGNLEQSPKDIGILLKEIQTDTLEECKDIISEKLFKYAWKEIRRIIVRGFPEYYKDKLLNEGFIKKD